MLTPELLTLIRPPLSAHRVLSIFVNLARLHDQAGRGPALEEPDIAQQINVRFFCAEFKMTDACGKRVLAWLAELPPR